MKLIKPSEIVRKEGGILSLAFGMKGTGKSTFAIDSADIARTLYFANFDRDATHLLNQYEGDRILYEEFKGTKTKGMAVAACERFDKMVTDACQADEGVFAIDNGSAWWDMVKLAYLPEKSSGDIYPKEFGEANNYMRWVVSKLEASNLYTVITCPAMEIWKQMTAATGLFTFEGWKHLGNAVINAVYLYSPGQPEGVPLNPAEADWNVTYRAIITNAKWNPTVQGTVMEGQDRRLATLLKWTKTKP